MQKKNISSLELAAIVNELQFLVKGKISQIYHQEKTELLLQLHAIGKGKQYLKIVPGKFLSLTTEKDAPLRPTGFCMLLRKYLSNAFIKSITQKDSERILVFEFDKKETFYLIIELFSKGNIVLTNKDLMIIGSLDRQIWKDRIVRAKEEYVFPTPGVNWKEIGEKKLQEILRTSDKKNLAVALATELGLGGVYAEEVCKLNGLDKSMEPSQVSTKEISGILNTLKEFLQKIKQPAGYIYEDNITPFALKDQQEIEKIGMYSEALDRIKPFLRESPYEQKIKSLNKTIATQEAAIKEQEQKIEDNSQKGELIYEKYTPLQKLLDIVKELKKENGWQEIEKELKKEKKIQSVNLIKKSVVIEL
ncbi:MAG: NFACT family protein [archaeon]|nr:NFACT family protein [archaeon]